jgi:hypothetical protein
MNGIPLIRIINETKNEQIGSTINKLLYLISIVETMTPMLPRQSAIT